LLIRSFVAHDTHRFHREEHGKRLGDLLIQPGRTDFFYIDIVCFLKNLYLFTRDRSQDADSKSRTWERMPIYEVWRDGKKTS